MPNCSLSTDSGESEAPSPSWETPKTPIHLRVLAESQEVSPLMLDDSGGKKTACDRNTWRQLRESLRLAPAPGFTGVGHGANTTGRLSSRGAHRGSQFHEGLVDPRTSTIAQMLGAMSCLGQCGRQFPQPPVQRLSLGVTLQRKEASQDSDHVPVHDGLGLIQRNGSDGASRVAPDSRQRKDRGRILRENSVVLIQDLASCSLQIASS